MPRITVISLKSSLFPFFVCITLLGSAPLAKEVRKYYELSLPENWKGAPQDTGEGDDAVFLGEIDEAEAFLVVSVEEAKELTIDAYIGWARKEIKSTFPDVEFLFERQVEQDKVPWREIIYSYSDAGQKVQCLHLLTVFDDKAVSFGGVSAGEDFGRFLNQFREIFMSWRFRR